MTLRNLIPITVVALITGCWTQHSKNEAPRTLAKADEEKRVNPMPRLADLDRILVGLRSADEKARESSGQDLNRLNTELKSVTLEDGVRALRAAAEPFPFNTPDPKELSENLVRIAALNPRAEYISVILSVFEKYSDKAKRWALVILAELESREAATAYMEIIRSHADAGRIPELVIGPLEKKPRHADIFFPELLGYGKNPKLAFDVYRLCLAYCDAGLLSTPTLTPYSVQLLGYYQSVAARLRKAQQSASSAEFVGSYWLRQFPKVVIQRGFHRVEGAESI